MSGGIRRSKRKMSWVATQKNKYARGYRTSGWRQAGVHTKSRAVPNPFSITPNVMSVRQHAGPSSMTYRGNTFFPDRYNNIMHYIETWNVTDAAGYITYEYRQNGLQDPYVAAGGAACYGIDQMQAIYKMYMVTYSKIFVSYVNNDDNDPVTLSIFPCATAGSSGVNAQGQPDVKSVVVTNQAGKEVLSHGRSIKSQAFPNAMDAQLASLCTTVPAKQFYWQIRVQGTAGTALSGQIKVDILYYTTWFERFNTNNTDN